MSDFISVLDLVGKDEFSRVREIKDEVADIDNSIRKQMDAGLSVDDMKTARLVREAADAAAAILNKLL